MRRSSPIRFALAAVAAVVIVVALIDHVKTVVAYRYAPSDFTQDYLAGRAWRAGESIYTPIPENPGIAPVFGPGDGVRIVNDHPPPYVLTLVPLSLLPYDSAFTLLGLASFAAAAISGWLVARELGLSPSLTLAVVAAVLVHPGVHTCLWAGNVSLLLMLLITLGWIAMRRGLDGWAGALVGLAAVVKLVPALIAVAFLTARRYPALGVFAAVGAAGLAGSVVAAGWDDHRLFLTERAPENASEYRGHGFNLSWPGVVHRLIGEPSPRSEWHGRMAIRPEVAKVAAVGGQVVILTIAVFAAVKLGRGEKAIDRTFAVLVPAMLLVSPLTWLHAVPVMLVPVAVLASVTQGPARKSLLIAFAALTFVPDRWLAEHLLGWLAVEQLPGAAGILLLAPAWGMLGLFGLAVGSAKSS